MQISKSLLTCGAAALCLFSTSTQADDNDAKLRELLRQKLAETSDYNLTAAALAAPTAEEAAQTEKLLQALRSEMAAKPVVPAGLPDDEATQKLRLAVRKLTIQGPIVPAGLPDDEATQKLRLAVRELTGHGPIVPAGLPDDEATQKLRLAVRDSLAQQPAKEVVVTAEPEPKVEIAPVVVTPPPATKAERLALLLDQYKADKISPQQYHEGRAKILAE